LASNMIYAGHHMAGRVPQNGRYFQFLRMALYSSFSTFLRSRFPRLYQRYCYRSCLSPLSRASSSLPHHHPLLRCIFLHSAILPADHMLSSALSFPLPALIFCRFSNVLLESDSIFTPALLSYGAAIFHDLILERGKKHAEEEG